SRPPLRSVRGGETGDAGGGGRACGGGGGGARSIGARRWSAIRACLALLRGKDDRGDREAARPRRPSAARRRTRIARHSVRSLSFSDRRRNPANDRHHLFCAREQNRSEEI